MKYRVEAIETTRYYIEVEASNADEAYEIAEQADGGEFTEIKSYDGWEILAPQIIGIETKEIDVADFGVQNVAKGSDQDAAVENGYDDSIFFYAPDDVFTKSDAEIKKFVEENVF